VATTVLTVRGLRFAIRLLVDRQIETSLDAVTTIIEERFAPAQRILETLGKDVRNGTLPTKDPEALAKVFARVLEFEEGIAWISFGYLDGAFAGVRAAEGEQFINISHPGSAAREWRLLRDGRLAPVARASLPDHFDSRKRTWFERAIQQPGKVWTPPYKFADGQHGITVSMAVRDEDTGKLMGVLTVDFYLKDVEDYLQQLTNEFRGNPMIFSSTGALVAAPRSLEASPQIESIRNRIFSDFLERETGGRRGNQILEVSTDTDTYFAGIRSIETLGGLRVFTAILFSRREAFGAVQNIMWTSLGAGLVALVLSLGVGIVVAGRIASPLKSLAREVRQVGDFHLDSSPLPQSQIQEVRILSEAVDRMRTSLKSFSYYVPVDLVRDLVRGGNMAELGGERRQVAIFFCDLASFTRFSERKTPEEAVQALTTYFEAFGQAIHAQGGIIDKFLGDGLMALFNAPLVIASPAAMACRAALEGLEAFARNREALGGLDVRVGLHFGEALIGNVGTSGRFAYTAIGDAVNLASRLEGLNKFYGTRIIASGEMRAAAGEEDFFWRRLDHVAVVEREEPLEIHELVCASGLVTPALREIRARYERALALILDGRTDEALPLLEALADSDAASKFLLGRARQPQPEVFRFTEK